MLTVVLGLSGALAYGVADFLGGVASRRARAIMVTAIAGTIGIVRASRSGSPRAPC